MSMTEERIDLVLTQYRESPRLLYLLRTYLGAAEDMHLRISDLPSYFDLETAVSDQLTLLGKRMGWPRCHCVCNAQPVFGFDCEGYSDFGQPLAGFCEANSTWAGCGEFGTGEVCISDDELYRKFLKVRRLQFMRYFNMNSLEAALYEFWGPTAKVLDSGQGRVVIAPGRELTGDELSVIQLYPRVLPLAIGVQVRFHLLTDTVVFGFGEGWGGFCNEGDPLPLLTEGGEVITDENDDPILVSNIYDSPWMCETDVKPYSC